MNELDTIELKNGHTLKIYHDFDPVSPREWDNLTEMICFHRNYKLGDDHSINHENYVGFDEIVEENTTKDDIVMPLYLYDHSGITIATTPFGCPWDSSQVGFVVVRKQTIDVEFDGDKDKAFKCLESEISVYDQYIRGEVYGYILEDSEGEEIDSCWGFFGHDHATNGIYDNAGIKAQDVA